MKTEEPEKLLPDGIRQKAVMSSREWGWRKQDILAAIVAAKSAGLANIGGQVQFVFPDGTCELYWRSYDSTDRKTGENWNDFVTRSAQEVLQQLQQVLQVDLVTEGIQRFQFLAEKASTGKSLDEHLVFIAYFQENDTGEPSDAPAAECR